MKRNSKASIYRRVTNAPSIINDTSDNKSYDNVMLGHFENCPSLGTKMIKVFLSSTFADMTKERNVIMKYVYPKLRLHCRQKYGIEFQFLDMRWGVPSDTLLDHRASEICFQEIINCKEISCGINFIVIIGHRYGTISLPYSIPGSEFRKILSVLHDIKVDTHVLEEWYIVDNNNDPPRYNLRPIQTSSDEPTVEEIKTARSEWSKTEEALTERIVKAINILVDKGEMNPKDKKRFCSSVTEQEIEMGICDEDQSRINGSAAAFIRVIADITNFLGNPKVGRYIDVKEVSPEVDAANQAKVIVDECLHEVMNNVINDSIKGNLSTANIRHFRTDWKDLNENENKSEYFSTFQDQFLGLVTGIIDKNMSDNKDATDDLYNEVLQHSIGCMKHVKHFQGRGELIEKVKDYIQGDSNVPLIVYGQSGSGKTSILAKAAFLSRSWLNEQYASDTIILLRFLGTSPGTSNIRHTIRYLCLQLSSVFGEQDNISKIDDFKELLLIFYQTLERLSENRKIFIFLDSIDQLQATDGAFTLNWLVTPLRPNVKMILSTLPDHEGILNNFRLRLEEESHYLEVMPLEQSTCMDILLSLLREKERTITEQQRSVLVEAFNACSLPIYVTLVYKEVLKWRSYHTDKSNELALKFTVREAIFQFFRNLEKTYNTLYVRHSLAYITASRNGLSEAELEDILSLDDLVLQSVFVYHLPPQIRVPPFLWSRIRQEIGSYLVEREADNCRVLYWYHRQFIEVAHEYFLKDKQFKIYIHANMADYFLGTYANNKPKRFYYPHYIVKKENLPAYTDEGRNMPVQPLIFNQSNDSTNSSTESLFNYRRINELPWHLVHSGRFGEFGDQIIFNYNFILTKLKISSRSSLLADFSLLEGHPVTYENSLSLLFNAIRLSTLSLSQDPANIGFDLIGRLSKYSNSSHPRILDLLEQCHQQSHPDIGFIPNGQCLESGSGLLYLWFDIGMRMAVVLPNNQLMAISLIDSIITYYDSDGNIAKTVESDVNIFMAMKQLLIRRPTIDTRNMTVLLKREKHVAKTTDEIECGNAEGGSSKLVKVVYQLNLYSGKLTEVREFDNDLPDEAIFDVSDRYIQVDSRKGMAKLYNIHEDRYLYEHAAGVIHTCLGLDNTAASVLYASDGHVFMDIINLEKEDIITVGINSTLKALCCYNMQEKALMAIFKRDDDIHFYRYHCLENVLQQDENVIVDKLAVASQRVKVSSFHNGNIVIFAMQMNRQPDDIRSTHGFIFKRRSNTILPLVLEINQAKFKKHLKIFGESEQHIISEEEDLLFTTGSNCLLMTWSLMDGSLLRVLSFGTVDSFLVGIFTGINKIAICHFPDESSDVERIYILAKLYNIDELRKPMDVLESNESEDVEILEEHISFNDKCKYFDLSYDPLEGLMLMSHLSDTYIIDTIENLTIRSAHSTGPFLYLSLLEACNDSGDVVFRVHNLNTSESKTIVSPMIENSEFSIEANDLDGVLLKRINSHKFFFKNAPLIFGFSGLIPGWIVSLENISADLYSRALSVNALSIKNSSTCSTSITFDLEAICQEFNGLCLEEFKVKKFKLCNISLRSKHERQLVVMYRSHDRNYDDILKQQEHGIIAWMGVIVILEVSIVENMENKPAYEIKGRILHSSIADIGRSLTLFGDGRFAVNYKLQKIDITTGEAVEAVAQIDSNSFLLDPLLIHCDRYILGPQYMSPYKVAFSIGIDEKDIDEKDMFTMFPPRTLQMYDMESGRLVASYPFENESESFMVSRNNNFISSMTKNETIRCMRINTPPNRDLLIRTKYDRASNTAMRVNSSYGYLRLILTKAVQEVVDKRPQDPISFLARYLRNNSITLTS